MEEYLEFLIPKEKLVVSSCNTSNLAKKEKIFSESFQDTVTTLKQALSDDTYDFNTFDTFRIFLEYKKLLSNDEEKVRNTIQTSPLYQAFLENNQEVYHSPYLTGNFLYINDSDISHIIHQDAINEVLGEKGFFIFDDCMKRSKTEENELLRDLVDGNFESRKNILMKVRRN